ncbi:MAG: hypothetical protein AAGE84_26925 [Cyanobacteria bacterium P01_G01_bin.39]
MKPTTSEKTSKIHTETILKSQKLRFYNKFSNTNILETNSVKTKADLSNNLISYLEIKEDDSKLFGYSLAISSSYLAVGDPGANRVVIYHRQADSNWLRSYEIYPPKKSREYGFGYDLALNDNVLIIHAYDYKDIFASLNKKTLSNEEVYLASLDVSQIKSQGNRIKRIERNMGR